MRKYLRAANVGWAGLILDDVKQMNFTDDEMKTFRLEPNDLVLNEASGSAKEVGKTALWNGEIRDCAFQNTLLRVRPSSDVNPRYLLHYFSAQASIGAFALGSRGVGINHLGKDALSKWPVPLPPLNEQRRIAAVLDHTDRLRTQRGLALDALQRAQVSLFDSMFTPPPGEWESAAVGDLIVDSQLGLVRASNAIDISYPFDYVRMDAITPKGQFTPREGDRVRATKAEVDKYSAYDGDLLFNTRNTRELVGKSAIFRGRPRLINNNILRIRFDDTRILPEYAHSFFWSPTGQRDLDRRKSGTTSVFAIYEKQLRTVPIPVPPLDLQREYADALSTLSRQSAAFRIQAEQLDELLASLRARAFRGEL